MKKSYILGGILVIFVISIGYAVGSWPYLIYVGVLTDTFKTKWYTPPANHEALYAPAKKIEIDESSFKVSKTNTLWKKFNVAGAKITLPINHPLFSLVPIIKSINIKKRPHLGYEIISPGQIKMASFFFVNRTLFSLQLNSHKLFEIPVVRNLMKGLDVKKVWKDLFTLNLKVTKITAQNLVYNLHLLKLRSFYLPRKYKTFSFIE